MTLHPPQGLDRSPPVAAQEQASRQPIPQTAHASPTRSSWPVRGSLHGRSVGRARRGGYPRRDTNPRRPRSDQSQHGLLQAPMTTQVRQLTHYQSAGSPVSALPGTGSSPTPPAGRCSAPSRPGAAARPAQTRNTPRDLEHDRSGRSLRHRDRRLPSARSGPQPAGAAGRQSGVACPEGCLPGPGTAAPGWGLLWRRRRQQRPTHDGTTWSQPATATSSASRTSSSPTSRGLRDCQERCHVRVMLAAVWAAVHRGKYRSA
jgi:hypothetical protein